MKKYILILGLALVLSSCRPLWLGMVDPSGPPEYKLGWEDGCDSGISAEGNWADKMMYGFKKRQEMAANDLNLFAKIFSAPLIAARNPLNLPVPLACRRPAMISRLP